MPADASKSPFFPHAGILAWIWPGLGHLSLHDRPRAFGVMGGMLLLIISGLLIGGVDCVDRKQDKLWFYAQLGCGPIVIAADYYNNAILHKTRPPDLKIADPQNPPPWLATTSFGRPNEIGTLFIALAGLMNLVAILDAFFYRPRYESPPASPESLASPAPPNRSDAP